MNGAGWQDGKKYSIKKNEYSIGQSQIRKNELTVKRNEFAEKAGAEKKIQLEKYELAIGEATSVELQSKSEVDRVEG